MKKTNIIFWILTALFALYMGGGAIPGLMGDAQSAAVMEQLGYPPYLMVFLSLAKLLGSIAILVPGFQRIKEWAYAGLFFDLTGATYSLLMSGEGAGAMAFMLVGFLLFAGSYIFYHKRRKAAVEAGLRPAY
ncbi:DoxX family protein [Chitinophaga sp. XS-30]|uniref:DoxX family protein n=1 Tax=Chitinophaga sp. XS-30 TaxID=2604421 RepID=UPI0011DCF042|nr:DoxX family protein [Chitinophaga sp. XS-30]QEH41627.1 DoxX family protein [Chitinophaga sp. XS-30]